MIVVLTGTNPYSFDRLVRVVDELAESRGWDVFVQLGNTAYEPRHCSWERFMKQEALFSIMAKADLIVSQGGFGSIRDGLAMGKKVVAVPRRPDLGESMDHQSGLVRTLEQNGHVLAVYDIDDLESVIDNAGGFTPKAPEPSRIPAIIRDYLGTL